MLASIFNFSSSEYKTWRPGSILWSLVKIYDAHPKDVTLASHQVEYNLRPGADFTKHSYSTEELLWTFNEGYITIKLYELPFIWRFVWYERFMKQSCSTFSNVLMTLLLFIFPTCQGASALPINNYSKFPRASWHASGIELLKWLLLTLKIPLFLAEYCWYFVVWCFYLVTYFFYHPL